MASGWTLQKQKRAKGTYWQAACGKGDGRRVVTLGYLTEQEAEAALVRLRGSERLALHQEVVVAEVRLHEPLPDQDNQLRPYVADATIRSWAFGTTADECVDEAAEAEVRRMIATGAYGRMKLKDFVDHVWAPARSRGWSAPGSKKQHNADTAARTWEREEFLWRNILRVVGDVRVENLDAEKWARVLRSNPKWGHRSQVLAQNAYRVMLKFCVHRKILKELHPFDVLLGDDEPARKVTPLLPHEVEALLANAPTLAHKCLWMLCASVGCRPGEAKKARFEDVEWNTGIIHVKGTKTRGSDRHLPLPPGTFQVLLEHRAACGCPETGWMFPCRKGEGCVEDLRSPLETAARKAGIKVERIHPNQLRHSFASIAAFYGLPKVVTKAYMGHTDASPMLDRVYEHARPEQLVDAIRSFPVGGASAAK